MSAMDTTNTTSAPTSSLAATPYSTAAGPWLPTLHQISAALQLRMKPEVVFVPAVDAPVQPSLFELEAEGGNEEAQSADAGMMDTEEDSTSTETPDTASLDAASLDAAIPNAMGAQRVITSVVPADHPLAISMRQGLLLLVLSALLAGLLPFIWNWYSAVQFDTVTPFVPLARFAVNQADATLATDSNLAVLTDTAATLVGLDPYWPVNLAAGFTALGEWINWPLRWLSIWLVYGLGVFIICALFGTTTTLQHFFATTGYAAVPLLLTGLYFVPVLGVIAVLAGVVWSVLVYVHGVRAVTGLDTIHAALGVAAPAAIMALLSFLATAGLLAFIYALLF